MYRRGLCNAISVAYQLRKKAAAAEIGRLGVWTNHVKISSVRERSTAQRAHCKSPHAFGHAFGLGNDPGVVCAVVGALGGKVTVCILNQKVSRSRLVSPRRNN